MVSFRAKVWLTFFCLFCKIGTFVARVEGDSEKAVRDIELIGHTYVLALGTSHIYG